MPELFDYPLLLPILIGFVSGVFFTVLINALCGGSARAAARAREKADREKFEDFQVREEILKDDLALARSSEAAFLKRQGELEALVNSDQKQREEMAQFLGFARTTLQTELRKHEHSIVTALQGAPLPPPDQQIQPAQPIQPIQPIQPTQPIQPAPVPATSAAQDDRDFVPLQQSPAETPREANFEGFAMEPTSQKAESAAKALRAALENPPS
jgi:hypothetical protein